MFADERNYICICRKRLLIYIKFSVKLKSDSCFPRHLISAITNLCQPIIMALYGAAVMRGPGIEIVGDIYCMDRSNF